MVALTTPSNLYQRANEYFLNGNYIQAANLYEQAIAVDPEIKSNYWHLGLIFLLQEQEVEAQTTWFMAMMEGDAEQVNVWNAELLEILETEAERQEKLEKYNVCEKIRQNIRQIAPDNIHNLLHLINLYIKLETYTEETFSELDIIEIINSTTKTNINLEILCKTLSSVLHYIQIYPSTIEFFEACSLHFTENPQALMNIFIAAAVDIAYSRQQPKIAAQLCEIYLRLDKNNPGILGHLASFYQNSADYELGIETAKTFYSLVERLPEKIFANRQILRGLMSAGGQWQESYAVNQRQQDLLAELIAANPQDLTPMDVSILLNSNYFAFYIEDNIAKNRSVQNKILQICQENHNIYAQEKVEKYAQGHLERKKQLSSHKKLKIGYISHCFKSHSVGWLARWLLQYHDRDKFEINGYFVNSDNVSDLLHQWYINQMDKVFKSYNVWSLAEEIYQDEIDILIDLDSITLDITCEAMTFKPAPIQVTWLGWDASGSPSIDYFIADPYVLSESAQEYYQEKIWRLPQTYIAVDGFEVNVPKVRRDELDIPDDAVVYFSGQRGFKRHPDITRLQLKIIKEVPNSYFLIKGLADEESTHKFFAQIAAEEEVDYARLRFLPDAPSEGVHRANLDIADIVLDTYPYNGATTTLETLWMCIPMVTRVGEQFAARNSYTMMMNAGISEGIAWTDEEYLEWGIRLGKDAALRQQIAWRLRQSRKTSPLWNGKQFAREMETAYEQMWQKYTTT
ncbi:O-linked N-acetylglucosamine transferase, SPINDLY family protein [Nostoc sp. LEGE 06077]|uniref:O-linked N-acetylglucosamine transferase, SPINDLY family protein n=1 Tax=Nostoc sp. LEGE 06077 TaxID=915325 RepID=UPI00188223EC|nr:O-linked N-acetylglucosamine transferase, SPINDLY family protein [Nostoc sp. LEGE 06077]MBE9208642.1 O-linked N-acetylglucosamine transferase, SPINDLY family protein [Nostoc sp. LEGE 06077]